MNPQVFRQLKRGYAYHNHQACNVQLTTLLRGIYSQNYICILVRQPETRYTLTFTEASVAANRCTRHYIV